MRQRGSQQKAAARLRGLPLYEALQLTTPRLNAVRGGQTSQLTLSVGHSFSCTASTDFCEQARPKDPRVRKHYIKYKTTAKHLIYLDAGPRS